MLKAYTDKSETIGGNPACYQDSTFAKRRAARRAYVPSKGAEASFIMGTLGRLAMRAINAIPGSTSTTEGAKGNVKSSDQ